MLRCTARLPAALVEHGPLWPPHHRRLPRFENCHRFHHIEMGRFLAYRVCFAAELWWAVSPESEGLGS